MPYKTGLAAYIPNPQRRTYIISIEDRYAFRFVLAKANCYEGSYIIYVNGSCRYSQTALSKLMHDFFCTSAKDMYYKPLQKRVKYFKETKRGMQTMCKIMEELKNEGFAEGKNEGILMSIKSLKVSQNWTTEQALAALNIDKKNWESYIALL